MLNSQEIIHPETPVNAYVVHPDQEFAIGEIEKKLGKYGSFRFQSGYFRFPATNSYAKKITGFSKNVSLVINFCPEEPNFSNISSKKWGIWFNDYTSCGRVGKSVGGETLEEAWQLLLDSVPNNNSIDIS